MLPNNIFCVLIYTINTQVKVDFFSSSLWRRLQDTVHKRLILAAATLPVLQVPLHAFYLLVPHLTTLLEVALTAEPSRDVQSRSTRKGLGSKLKSVAGAADAVERAWVDVLDLCSGRLGPSLASVVVLPAVLNTLTG